MSIDDTAAKLLESIPSYDQIAFIANHSILFRGTSLSDWSDQLSFSELKTDLSLAELEAYNIQFIHKSEIIMKNVAFARSACDLAKIQYKSTLGRQKIDMLSDFKKQSIRAPAKEVLEIMALDAISSEHTAYQIAELLLEFWVSMHIKLKLVSERLTSLNILRNVESRYANQ